MQKILLYLLFFTYASSICKPLIPYISDCLSHTFYYQEHIKTVHHENGKSHVHYELVKQAKQSTDDKENAMKKISLANEHIIATGTIQFYSTFITYRHPSFKLPYIFGVTLKKDFPPPRC